MSSQVSKYKRVCEREREFIRQCLSLSVIHLSCGLLSLCFFSNFFPLCTFFFGSLSSFFIHLSSLPVIPFLFSSLDSLSYPLYHCCFQRTRLPPSSLILLLSPAWHCAMVEKGLCPDASWLRDWDFRRLDQRGEVKERKRGKGAITTEGQWRGDKERREEGKDGLEKPNKGKVECGGMELSVFPRRTTLSA